MFLSNFHPENFHAPHNDLGYRNIVYDVYGRTREEMETIAEWLIKNS